MPDEQTLGRTVATLVFIVAWVAMVLGPSFVGAEPVRYEIRISVTAIVFAILGRMWDFEVQRVLNGLPLPDGGETQTNDQQNDD